MLRLLSVLVMQGTLLFGVVYGAISVARVFGETMPHASTYLDPSDCPLPCWQGFRPGMTLDDPSAFDQQVALTNRYQAQARIRDDGQLREFEFFMRGDITLGDVILALGEPSHGYLYRVAGTTQRLVIRQALVGGVVYFGDGLIEVRVVREDVSYQDGRMVWRFSPQMVVRSMKYYAPHPEGNAVEIGTPRWPGFKMLKPPS